MVRSYVLVLTTLTTLLFSTMANAAELYGKFSAKDQTILQGARIAVICGGWHTTQDIGADGTYSVRGIPGNSGCYFKIQHPSYTESAEVKFSTSKSSIAINAELILRNQQILVLNP